MGKTKKTTNRTYRLYILFKEGELPDPGIIKILTDNITKNAKLEDFGTGSAYNMPSYLLDAIEGHEDNAMVVAWDWDEDDPHPRFLVEPQEISPLIDALKLNPGVDSWETAVIVNKQIRGER